MANERITENFFREFVLQDKSYKNDKIIFEEQSSKNIKIDKLLKNASKSGDGKGYPEFIIQFKENPDFIIVAECKADIKHHKSKNRDKYKDYAVDGVLLYSSFLSKEFDVLSIAISGEEKSNLRISHFLQLKGTNQYHSIFTEDKFLPLEDYLIGYQTDERKFNQDFQELLKYSKTLNDNLHTLKVPESNRSLLISGALIALQDKAFYNAYKYQKPKELAENLINTIKNKLTDVQNKHIEDIVTSYSFIKTHTILSREENKLRDIIESVDKKINNFIKTYKYFDTLGQFYIEFLRYANNDKGLGIVLTPPHITELFCEIANVNKDSVVLDTCTGTGGFLISAMKQMIIDAGGDKKKELNIKSKQIIGVELQHSIFSLACSNMYIHGDGRSNLIKGSCFDEKVIEEIKKYKPNVGLLNPPYGDKKYKELEFILNNLTLLEKGSYCVAIVPMSSVLSTKGEELLLKEKLLANHTLEAVFSMPTELFHNSKVNVVTAVIVVKAKEKHPKNYKTYFGYWKDDGFYKKKTSGRSDYDNKWSQIKKYWLENYKNKDEVIGHSVKRVIAPSDEWCVEAYMQTDYSNLTSEDFSKVIRDFIAFKILSNKKVSGEMGAKLNNKKYSLDVNKWQYFEVQEIFPTIEKTKGTTTNELVKGNEIPYIAAKKTLNGLEMMCSKDDNKQFISKGNCVLFIQLGAGSAGYTTYQEDDFIGMSGKTSCGYNNNLNKYNGLFLVTILDQERAKFSFGRSWTGDRLRFTKIKLPVDKNGEPNWQFMEDYIKSLPYSSNI